MPPSTGHSDFLTPGDAYRERGAVRRPLPGLLAGVCAGILAGSLSAATALPWLVAAWIALGLAAIPVLARARTALLYALLVLLAAAHTASIVRPSSPDHLAARMLRPVEHLKLAGVVADDPVREPSHRPDRFLWRFPLQTDALLRERTWQSARGRVEVLWETTNAAAQIRYGERRLLEGPIQRGEARLAAAPLLRMRVDDRGVRILPGEGGWWLRRWCLEGRRASALLLGAGLDDAPDAVALIRALMLGYQHELPDDARQAFAQTGTLHIVAISGAHVGMVAMLMLALVRAAGLPQPRWPLIMAPLLVVYALSTGMAPSAVRACLMAITMFMAYACWRQPDSLSGLALAALILLGVSPGQLARPGFLLSFSVVAGLILLVPPVRNWLYARVWPTPEGARALRLRVGEPVRRFLLDLVAVTVVAWLVSTPLTAYYFNLFSPVALLANLVVVPLAFLILFAACLALLAGGLHPLLLDTYNHAVRVLCAVLFEVVGFFDRIPGGSLHVPTPPGWWVAVALVLLIPLVRGRRAVRGVAAGLALVLLAAVGWTLRGERPLSVAVHHLGPTAVAHAHLPGSGDWLFDTGPAFTRRSLMRFLDQRGVNRLRAVVLLRPTMESAGALPELLRERRVDELWIPPGRIRSRPFADLIARLEADGIPVVRRSRGERGPGWMVLHPGAEETHASASAGGLVIRISHSASAVMFAPPAEPALIEALAAAAQDYGAQAWIELGFPRASPQGPGLDALASRAALLARPMAPGDAFRAEPDEGRPAGVRIAPRGTLSGVARGRGFAWSLSPDDDRQME